MKFYQKDNPTDRFSRFMEMNPEQKQKILDSGSENLQIVTYCIMPTHIHLVLVQRKENMISRYMNNLLNSYTRYFNSKIGRKGPLWESRYKNILVKKDEQLQHLTRYIHLNPVSVNLVKKPEDWKYSSYEEYIGVGIKDRICNWGDFLEIKPTAYKKFVEERIEDQKELSKIKKILIENYSG